MVGADVRSTHHGRFEGVAERFQCVENPVNSSISDANDILKSAPTRAAFSDNSDGFEIEPCPPSIDAAAFRVGCAGILARGASDNAIGEVSEIGNNSICREASHVVIKLHPWEILRKHGAAPRIELARRNRFEPGPMQAE